MYYIYTNNIHNIHRCHTRPSEILVGDDVSICKGMVMPLWKWGLHTRNGRGLYTHRKESHHRGWASRENCSLRYSEMLHLIFYLRTYSNNWLKRKSARNPYVCLKRLFRKFPTSLPWCQFIEPLKIIEHANQLSNFSGEAEGETVYIPAEDEAEEVKPERRKSAASAASIPWTAQGTRHYGSNFIDLGNHRFWSIYYFEFDPSNDWGTQWLDPYQSSRFGVVFFAGELAARAKADQDLFARCHNHAFSLGSKNSARIWSKKGCVMDFHTLKHWHFDLQVKYWQLQLQPQFQHST